MKRQATTLIVVDQIPLSIENSHKDLISHIDKIAQNYKSLMRISSSNEKRDITKPLDPRYKLYCTAKGYTLNEEDLKKIKQLVGDEPSIDICGGLIDGALLAICYQLADEGLIPRPLFDLCGGEENRLEAQSIMKAHFSTTPADPKTILTQASGSNSQPTQTSEPAKIRDTTI
jgi:hypothetical protein